MRERKNKSIKITDSILARIELLERIISSPKKFIDDNVIKQALKSQRGLALLSYTVDIETGRSIFPMSITTLKARISTVSDGFNWESFDKLRVQALGSINSYSHSDIQSPTQTKLALKDQLKDLNNELENQREINLRLIQALTKSVAEIETVRSTNKEDLRTKRARDAIESINQILGLNDFPFNRVERPAIIITLKSDKTS
jgi:hypothetical protein